MKNKDPAYRSTPGLRRCAARRFQHTQLMSIEEREKSGKKSGRGGKLAKPRFQLSRVPASDK
jgi:hypothetical protein